MFFLSPVCRQLKPVTMETKCTSHKLLLYINSKCKVCRVNFRLFCRGNGENCKTRFFFVSHQKQEAFISCWKLKAAGLTRIVSWGQHELEKPSSTTLQLWWLQADVFRTMTQIYFLQPFLWENARNKKAKRKYWGRETAPLSAHSMETVSPWVIWTSCRLPTASPWRRVKATTSSSLEDSCTSAQCELPEEENRSKLGEKKIIQRFTLSTGFS